jgi:Fe/S biogenesis protein NfuA
MINPAIASHGGFVNLLDVTNNTVYLEFSGGCHGCGMANVTLKYGVERAIREQVPGVGEILDRTDHASGRNPYYTSP